MSQSSIPASRDSGVWRALAENPQENLEGVMLRAKQKASGISQAELSPAEKELAKKMAALPALELLETYEEWRQTLEKSDEAAVVSSLREQISLLAEKAEKVDLDHLTGAKSRAFFEPYVDLKIAEINSAREAKEFQRAGDENLGFCLMVLDIDNFKLVNDGRGHKEGDEVLKDIARITQDHLRDSDVVCRWGGDEFMVLVEASEMNGQRIAETLRMTIEKEVNAKRDLGENTATLSIGVVSYDPREPEMTREELAEKADQAAYHSKKAGRNQVTVYEPGVISPDEDAARTKRAEELAKTDNELAAVHDPALIKAD